MKVLAIESSCDETAAAIVSDSKEIISHVVVSQLEEHKPYGGVVPEIAARSHIVHLERLVDHVMQDAKLSYNDLDAVAVTAGPGLIGGVIVGVMAAKAIASAANIPFVAVNHLEGHALTVRLTDDVPFPFLLLLVSGGHCQMLSVEGVGQYTLLGKTMDDALGEAFDKVAKMMGLGYPGGPIVEKLARDGDAERFDFPMPLKGKAGCDFSFSGLKTAVKREVDALSQPLSDKDKADICSSFQRVAGEILQERIANAIEMFKAKHPDSNRFVIAGGVAANQYLRGKITDRLAEYGFTLHAAPLHLCTDNAAMIGWAAIEKLKLGQSDSLDFAPKARWPL